MKKITTITTLLFTALISTVIFAANGSWTFDGNGDWTNNAMWAGGSVPNGAGDNAYFTNTYVSDKIIAGILNSQNITVGGIYLNATRIQLPGTTVAGYENSTNITLDAGGGSPIIDVSNARLDVQAILEGTNGYTTKGNPTNGVLMIGATAKPISGPVNLFDIGEIIVNHKDVLMNADVIVTGALVNLRKDEFNTKTLTINDGGEVNVFQTDDTNNTPVYVTSDSITINAGGRLGSGFHSVFPTVAEPFDLLSPSITVNSGGRIQIMAGATKSVGGSNITVNSGGEVGFFDNFFTYTISNPLVLDGWGIAPSLGALTVQGVNNLTNNSPITLTGSTRIGMWGGGDQYMILNGVISGTGPLTLLGQAGSRDHIRRFELYAAHNYTGDTVIQGFACQNITTLHGNQRLPVLTLELTHWAPMDLTNTFDLNGYTQTNTHLVVNAGTGSDEIRIVGGTGGKLIATGVGNYGALMNGGGISLHGVTFDAVSSIIGLRNNVELTVTGSTVHTTGPLGYILMNHGPGNSTLNVGEDGIVDVQLLRLADMTDPANMHGVVNLNAGGVVKTSRIWVEGTNASDAVFNFNGGLLENHEDSTYDNAWILADHSNIVAAGANIKVDRNITIPAPLFHDPAYGGTPDGGLTKLGSGVLTISNICNYTGPTVVSEGTLIVNTIGSSKSIVVADGAIIGDISGNLAIPAGVTVSPGSSIGTMNVAVNLDMQSGSIYDWEVDAGEIADLINVFDAVDLSGAAVNSITVNVDSIGAVLPEETNVLFSAVVIIGNADTIFMSYAMGNSGPENPTINGNNIEISNIVIPEPGFISLLCLFAFAFFGRKK